MTAYLRATAGDNEGDLRRLHRNLSVARLEELTPRQRQILHMSYEEGKSMTAIAQELGINKSTVSRTLSRAKHRLYRCLRYGI